MDIKGTRMVSDGKTARQLFEEVMANPARTKFGFGEKLAIVNVDVQQAYTRMDMFKTAYETDPRQIEHVNRLARLLRALARRYPLREVVGHEHVAPGRKQDPGNGFQWSALQRALGLSAVNFPIHTSPN